MNPLAPHKCPDCGADAYIGLNQVECTSGACRHFHSSFADENTPTEPLLFVNPELQAAVAAYVAASQAVSGPAPFDWGNHVNSVYADSVRTTLSGDRILKYQLPAGASGSCTIGEPHTDPQGVTWCVVSIDRFTDEIEIMRDPRSTP